jgi:hypothetical protein
MITILAILLFTIGNIFCYHINGDYPLELIYMRIEMLSEQNKRLISRLKSN